MLPPLILKQSNGKLVPFQTYEKKILLIVNTASQCGLASQMKDLEMLYQKYKNQDFVVLGFPCDQFAQQERFHNSELQEQCFLHFGVTFPLHEKCDVNGANTHPLFAWLKKEKKGFLGEDLRWNFTKFLVDPNGKVVKRFAPQTSIQSIEAYLQKHFSLNL